MKYYLRKFNDWLILDLRSILDSKGQKRACKHFKHTKSNFFVVIYNRIWLINLIRFIYMKTNSMKSRFYILKENVDVWIFLQIIFLYIIYIRTY